MSRLNLAYEELIRLVKQERPAFVEMFNLAYEELIHVRDKLVADVVSDVLNLAYEESVAPAEVRVD